MNDKTSQFTPQQDKFLVHYAENGVVQRALTHVRASRADLREWRADEDFSIALREAKDASVEMAEAELRRRGMGYDEPLVFQGHVIYQRDPANGELLLDENFDPIPFKTRKHSDRLLEVYMRANDARYKDRTQVEHTGDGGGAIKNEHVVRYVMPEGKSKQDYED